MKDTQTLNPLLKEKILNYKKAQNKFIKNTTEKNIHKLRVSIRRLQSGLELYQSLSPSIQNEKFEKKIKVQFKKLGKIRNLQITEEKAPFPEFRKYIQKKEKKEIHSLHTLKNKWKKQTNPLLSTLEENEPHSTHLWAHHLLTKIHESHEIFATDLKKANPESIKTIHQVRISLKKYRYLLELGLSEFPQFETELKNIRKLQNSLGNIQDLEILEKYLKKFAKKNKNSLKIKLKIKSLEHLKVKKAQSILHSLHKNPHLPSPFIYSPSKAQET